MGMTLREGENMQDRVESNIMHLGNMLLENCRKYAVAITARPCVGYRIVLEDKSCDELPTVRIEFEQVDYGIK